MICTAEPRGAYRYGVAVGDRQFMVDDARKLETGTEVGICLKPEALHLYPKATT